MKPLDQRSVPIVATLIVVAIFAFAYHSGRRSADSVRADLNSDRQASTNSVFRIAGDSMAPTLVDGDLCQLADPTDNLRIGDVVAIRWGGKRHIKRIAALGADVVDRVDGRLTIGDRRLEDIMADRDDREFLSPALVQVSSQPDHWSRDPAIAGRRIYGHRNPFQAGRITAVMDDYPINNTVRRILNPVDRLVLEIRTRGRGDAIPLKATVRVSFFDAEQSIVSTTTRNRWARFRDASTETAEDAGGPNDLNGVLDAAHPIAVDLDPRQASQVTLHVYREIEYRDDQPSGNVHYPMTLGDDEVFVVGDNVPVSVDSRTVGPLKRSAILGQVEHANLKSKI